LRLRKFNICPTWGTTGVYNRKIGHACFNTFAPYAFIAETPSLLEFSASTAGFIFPPSLVQPEEAIGIAQVPSRGKESCRFDFASESSWLSAHSSPV
jgi:hypothetical protein